MDRLTRVRTALRENGASAFLITNFYSMLYLTGFSGISEEEREATLVVTGSNAYLYVPRMYEFQARKLERVQDGVIELVVVAERNLLLTGFREHLPDSSAVMVEARDLKVAELDMLNQETDFSFRSTSGVIEQQREVKDPDEIDRCAKAAEITDKTWNELISTLRSTEYTQYSELDLVDMIRKISSDMGGEGFSFDPIVATGAGSAEPHYRTSSKKLQKDTPLLIDLGIKCEGYCGDLTRTVYLGKAPEKFRNIYEKVLNCNMISLEKCRAGVYTAQLTEVSKSCFREDGLEEYFIHGLGHGVGLEIHEEPFMRVKTEHKLKENSVVTIEPGLYFEGEFGIRIEDYVVVKQDGCKVLSAGSEKGLIEI